MACWNVLGGGHFKTAEQRKSQEGRGSSGTSEHDMKISKALETVAERKKTLITSVVSPRTQSTNLSNGADEKTTIIFSLSLLFYFFPKEIKPTVCIYKLTLSLAGPSIRPPQGTARLPHRRRPQGRASQGQYRRARAVALGRRH